jgi:hypothetical protein
MKGKFNIPSNLRAEKTKHKHAYFSACLAWFFQTKVCALLAHADDLKLPPLFCSLHPKTPLQQHQQQLQATAIMSDPSLKLSTRMSQQVLDQQTTKKVSATRTVWPKIQRHQRIGGKQVVVHPFLSADNEMDKIFVRHLIIDEPYLSKHGGISKAWSDQC